METTKTRSRAETVNRHIAENVAISLHRAQMKQSALATAAGISQPTLSRRMAAQQSWHYDEVEIIAGVFGLSAVELATDLPSFDEWQARWEALCACRDSNPKPSDLYPRAVEATRCGRCGTWCLVGHPCRTCVKATLTRKSLRAFAWVLAA